MTSAEAPEVDWVLTAAVDDHPDSPASASDIPLERIDGNNANNVDAASGWVHTMSEDPEEMNFLVATLTQRPEQVMGAEYNLRGDAIVNCRLIGVHIREFGAIDPGEGDEPTVSYSTVAWDKLTDDIRRAIATDRKGPTVGRTNVAYSTSFIEEWDDQSGNFGDYYLLTFNVRFHGFEQLP